MKFTNAVLFTTAAAVASVSAAPSVTTTSLSPTDSCLAACPTNANIANCQAGCMNVPHPQSSDIADTQACSENCDQGDGSPADTQAYGECLAACRTSFYFSSGTPAPGSAPVNTGSMSLTLSVPVVTTGGSGSGNGGLGNGGPGMTGTGNSGPANTQSGSGSKTTSSDGLAAGPVQIGAPVAGIAGLIMAIFAL